jgi:hypothetical protein
VSLIIDNPELEARLRRKADARGLSVDAYLSEREQEDELALRALRKRMDQSLAAGERDELVDGEEVLAKLLADVENTRDPG